METLRIAAEALRRHKMRSFLTLLGVIIGVTTVISVVSVISGLNDYVSQQVFTLNPDVFIATQFGIITSREQFLQAVKRKKITIEDFRAVEAQCTRCAVVGARANGRQNVRRASKHLSRTQIVGGTVTLATLDAIDVEAGRFFTGNEEQHSASIAVIGTDVRDELFGLSLIHI